MNAIPARSQTASSVGLFETDHPIPSTVLTTALPYANGSLHAGHLFEWLLADTWLRLARRQGADITWVTGDDSHGVAVSRAAAAAGETAQSWTDTIHQERGKHVKRLGLQVDHYGHTGHPHHHRFVQECYTTLLDEGWIKTIACAQYIDSDQVPLFERSVTGQCRDCLAPQQTLGGCAQCGRTIEVGDLLDPVDGLGRAVSLVHVPLAHFDWSGVRARVVEWIQSHIPKASGRDKWVSEALERPAVWCIERPGAYFGVPVPQSHGHFYVWFDALLGYASFSQQAGHSGHTFRHLVGKDIVAFHVVLLPALLLALGKPLPDGVWVHGHLVNAERAKLSKSAGAAPLEEWVERFGLDALRGAWVAGHTPGVHDVVADETLVSAAHGTIARRVGNTYRRLANIVDLTQPPVALDAFWAAVVLDIDRAAEHAVQTHELEVWAGAVTQALDTVNQKLSVERWWQEDKTVERAAGWAALLHILERAEPLWPETLKGVADVVRRGAWSDLTIDSVFVAALAKN